MNDRPGGFDRPLKIFGNPFLPLCRDQRLRSPQCRPGSCTRAPKVSLEITKELVEKLFSWRHSGFDIHNQVTIQSHDSYGWESLAQYVLRTVSSGLSAGEGSQA